MITISPFTQELWQAVMGCNPSHFTGDLQLLVEQVSWNDCWAFIKKLNELTGDNFRLPTEAARGRLATPKREKGVSFIEIFTLLE